MIQELLCSGGLVEERKLPIQGGFLLDGTSPSSAPATPPSSSSSSAVSSPSSSAVGAGGGDGSSCQNLRCPRCDSTNTKFCYYNNYNLTQPRHFCKTCRRYWTKGGALRNVPIGGGCRKTKTTGASIGSGAAPGAAAAAAAGNKLGPAKRSFSLDAGGLQGKPAGLGGGYGHELLQGYSNPILWPSTQQSSNLLSLLRASNIATAFQNANPNSNPNPNPFRVKEELSHLVPDATLVTNALNARSSSLGQQLDAMGHNICTPMWRNNGNQYQHLPYHHHQQQQQQQQEHQQQQHTLFGGEAPSSGIQDLYQRLRTNNNYFGDLQTQVLLGSVGASSSSATAATGANATVTSTSAAAATMLEPAAITGGEIGVWNLPLSWSDMPATNGAFP